MSYSDLVFVITGALFTLCMVPALRGNDKPPVSSSLTTSLLLFANVSAFAAIHQWYGMGTSVVTAATWAILAFQKNRRNSRNA